MNGSTPARAAVRMAIATAVSRAFGFVRVLVIAAVLGTTYLGNTFQAANSFSNVLFELLAAGALSAVLVPTFVQLFAQGDRAEADRLAGGLLGLAVVALGAISILGVVFAPQLARLLTSGAPTAEIAAEQRELTTFLLRFFVPQVVLYAFGTVATGLLYAHRRFAVTAAAPIANTVVVIAALGAFRLLAGPDPSLDLSGGERLLLAIAGTGGVLAFVGVLVVSARRAGSTLRPRWLGRDPALGRLVRLSGWGVLLHAIAGLLLGGAIVLGNGVAGGVVAYQVAFVFFLAPYAVLAQPIHTAVLPDLSTEAAVGDLDAFARSVRWSIDRMALLVVPVSAAMVALAAPAMSVVVFGNVGDGGVELIAAALAALAVGLFPYGSFLLLARACYALDDSRTPALVAVAAAVVGVVVMAVGASAAHGTALVAALGLGHSAAYTVGALALLVVLTRRVARPLVPDGIVLAVVASVPLALAAWWATGAVDPEGRGPTALWLALVGLVGGGTYAVFARRRLHAAPTVRVAP